MLSGIVLKANKFIEDGRRILEEGGVVGLEYTDNFNDVEEICENLGVDYSEHFNERGYMGPLDGNAILVKGSDRDGRIVALQALRRIDLRNLVLDDYLKKELPRLNGGIPLKTSPGPKKITGITAYHGLGFVKEEFRSSQIAPAITRLSKAIAMLEWPDITSMWGLTDEWLVLRGYNMRKAYAHAHPHVLEWDQLPRYDEKYWFIYDLQEDLEYMLDQGHQAYVATARKLKTLEVVQPSRQAV